MITTTSLNSGHGHNYFPGMEPGGVSGGGAWSTSPTPSCTIWRLARACPPRPTTRPMSSSRTAWSDIRGWITILEDESTVLLCNLSSTEHVIAHYVMDIIWRIDWERQNVAASISIVILKKKTRLIFFLIMCTQNGNPFCCLIYFSYWVFHANQALSRSMWTRVLIVLYWRMFCKAIQMFK